MEPLNPLIYLYTSILKKGKIGHEIILFLAHNIVQFLLFFNVHEGGMKEFG